MQTRDRLFIGTSGWSYKHWAGGVFYPPGLRQGEWLPYYAKHFNTVEVNATFYRLPQESTFRKWWENTPDGFAFTLKASRLITHVHKLAAPDETVGVFLERAQILGPKLRMLLFQLPPSLHFHQEHLTHLAQLMDQQSIVPGLRWALEVRHPTWLQEACYRILEEHNVALVFSDWPGCSVEGPVTADFVYLRRHGPGKLYASSYSPQFLAQEAERVRAWLQEGKQVYAYFNNDFHGYAVQNATTLRALVTGEPPEQAD